MKHKIEFKSMFNNMPVISLHLLKETRNIQGGLVQITAFKLEIIQFILKILECNKNPFLAKNDKLY